MPQGSTCCRQRTDINDLRCLEEPNTEEEGEEQLVLLEQGAAHVLVHAVQEVAVEVLNPRSQVLAALTLLYGLNKNKSKSANTTDILLGQQQNSRFCSRD